MVVSTVLVVLPLGLFLSFLDCFCKNEALFGLYKIYPGLGCTGFVWFGLGACCRVYG